MPPKRSPSHLQSPNPVKQHMLDNSLNESENFHANMGISAVDVISAPPSSLYSSLLTPPAPASETSHHDTAPTADGGVARVDEGSILALNRPSMPPAQALFGIETESTVEDYTDAVSSVPTSQMLAVPTTVAVSSTPPTTPPRLSSGTTAPPSPSTPRTQFLAGRTPARVCCNLDLVRAPVGTKLSLAGICVAVFPATSNPDRRYIQIADATGSTGLTIWNDNVCLFGPASVGKLVTCQRLVVTTHNAKRVLSMARDSTIAIEDDGKHAVVDWWQSLLTKRALTALEAHAVDDNAIITITGVVGQISEDSKVVNGRPRVLTTLHLVDSTGRFDVRTWNHVQAQFQAHVDKPIQIQRVRVTSFAGEKLAEFLDGQGSVIVSSFPGQDAMTRWWNSA
jgi:hypothetical protein